MLAAANDGAPVAGNSGPLRLVLTAPATGDGTSMSGPGGSMLAFDESTLMLGLGAVAIAPDDSLLKSGVSGHTLSCPRCVFGNSEAL